LKPDEAARWLGAARWQCRDGLAPAELERWLAAARAALAAGAEPRKCERNKAMFALAVAGSEPDALLKIERHADASFARRLARAPAVAQLRIAETLAARGIATPVPAAAGTCRRRGLLEASLLLVPIVPGAVDLAEFWRDETRPACARRAAARALGVLARRMHEAGVDQDDFALNNFLWQPSRPPQVMPIDFERTRIRRALARPAWTRQLAKLDRHAIGASASDRLRLLRAYAGGDAQRARAWWHAVAIEHGALARRDFRHMLRTGTRASRRFVPVSQRGWSGWARRDATLEAVFDAVAGAPATAPFACRARALGALDVREAARAWAAALTLAQRGCMPPPVALLRRDGAALLAYEPIAGAGALDEVVRDAGGGALVGLRGRLRVLGVEPDALAADAIELAPGIRGGWCAFALDPRGLRAGRPSREARARARAWAAQLLGAEDRTP
jgi:hypothetical protein